MPSREGYVQVVVQVPAALKSAADARRGETPLAQYVCGLIARDAGAEYTPPKKGAPVGTLRRTKPGPKPGAGPAEKPKKSAAGPKKGKS